VRIEGIKNGGVGVTFYVTGRDGGKEWGGWIYIEKGVSEELGELQQLCRMRCRGEDRSKGCDQIGGWGQGKDLLWYWIRGGNSIQS